MSFEFNTAVPDRLLRGLPFRSLSRPINWEWSKRFIVDRYCWETLWLPAGLTCVMFSTPPYQQEPV